MEEGHLTGDYLALFFFSRVAKNHCTQASFFPVGERNPVPSIAFSHMVIPNPWRKILS